MNSNKQKGAALIEAIIALAVAAVITTAIVIAVITSLGNSNAARNRIEANNLAQEGLDVARGIRDESFNSFQANYPTNTYCLGENDVLGGNCSDIDGIYQRRVYINHNGLDPTGTRRCVVNPESSFVRSTVSWTDSDCRNDIKCHSVQLDLCLSNLNSVPPL